MSSLRLGRGGDVEGDSELQRHCGIWGNPAIGCGIRRRAEADAAFMAGWRWPKRSHGPARHPARARPAARSTLMDWADVLRALWLFLPAYVANMAPVFVAKLVPGWKAPIDGGRVGKDGQRILGPGKTWRGLAGGTLLGGLVALAVASLAPHWGTMNGVDYSLGAVGPLRVLLFGACVGLMALVGDFVKSYFKRRRRIERGGSWFPFDQLDFVVF